MLLQLTLKRINKQGVRGKGRQEKRGRLNKKKIAAVILHDLRIKEKKIIKNTSNQTFYRVMSSSLDKGSRGEYQLIE